MAGVRELTPALGAAQSSLDLLDSRESYDLTQRLGDTGAAFVELFRQPDAQFATDANPMGYAFFLGDLGITMGQALSVPMILLGGALVLYARMRGAK